jgi:hypothetical protein
MVVVYDLEVVRNFFLYLDYNIDTGEISQFEISDFANDLPGLVKHLSQVKGQIGYNNISYDAQIIQHLIKNQKSLLKQTAEQVYTFLHEYSNKVIGTRDERRFYDYYEKDFSIPQLDLFKVWHYDNKARATSLKWLQYSMDWPNIEDMPISHLDMVNTEDIRSAVKYYCKNDVMSTYEFYKVSQGITENEEYKGKDKIKFRKDISSRLGISCRNFSDVKIGDEINKQNYLKATGKKWFDIKDLRTRRPKFTFGDCFPSYMEFRSEELKTFFGNLKDLYIDVNSDQKFKFLFDGVEYTIAKGGLHSKDRSRVVRATSDQILRDADVGSMYPNAIRKRGLYPLHLGKAWLEGYDAIIKERLDSKAMYKKTKDSSYMSVVEALKYALNGGSFGKTNEETNWQYDPFVTFAVTIGCQIDLLMLIESLVINGIRVISANTDGIVCLFDKNMNELYYKICTEWEKKVGNHDMGQLEYSDYELLAQTAVNSYIAIKKDGGVKYKNEFTIHHELHRNKSFRIIPLALNAFYTKGINPVTFIKNHRNIYDFCAGSRVNDKWYFEIRGIVDGQLKIERLLKTNRFYISNNGFKLMKMNKTDGREIQQNSGKWLCTIFNKYVEKPWEEYDVNYDFYIDETYKIITKMQPEIVNSRFTQLSFF